MGMFLVGFVWALLGAFTLMEWCDREVDRMLDKVEDEAGGGFVYYTVLISILLLWPMAVAAALVHREGGRRGWWEA